MNEKNEPDTLSEETWRWCANNLTMDDMEKIITEAMVRWCKGQKAEVTKELKETIDSFSATAAHQLVLSNDIAHAVNIGLSSFPPTPYDHLVDDEEQLTVYLADVITSYKNEKSV